MALSLTGLQESAIRGAISSDGVHIFSIYDFITKVCQYKDTGATARKEFKRLTDDGTESQAEIMGLVRYHKFPGAGQRSTPVMTIRGLQRLLAVLGHKVATDYRNIVESTFNRIIAGDMSFIRMIDVGLGSDASGGSEINQQMPASIPNSMPNSNAASMPASIPNSMPVANPASMQVEESALQPRASDCALSDSRRKRKISETREECELKLFNVGMEERWSRLRDQALARTERMMEILKRLRPNGELDEVTVGQIEEQTKSIVMNHGAPQGAQLAGQGAAVSASPGHVIPRGLLHSNAISNTISVSNVAEMMDIKCSFGQLKEIGKRMAAKYRATHQRDPDRHTKQVRGNMVAVNTYTEADRGMMEEVIREYMGIC